MLCICPPDVGRGLHSGRTDPTGLIMARLISWKVSITTRMIKPRSTPMLGVVSLLPTRLSLASQALLWEGPIVLLRSRIMQDVACVLLALLALVAASTRLVVVFMLCIGLTAWGLKYGISRGVRYPPILRPAHHSRKTGPLPWHSGPTRVFVISPTCSRTTARYSILRFAVIGPKVSGVVLVYPDNQSVVSSKLDLRHALSSYKRADHHSTKLTGKYRASRYTKILLPHDCDTIL